MSSCTSDYKRYESDVLWNLWVLQSVQALVSLTHVVYNEVTEFGVECDPTVDHFAVTHQ